MKKEKKKFNRKAFVFNIEVIIVVIALMLGVIGMLGYNYYEKSLDDQNNSTEETVKKDTLVFSKQYPGQYDYDYINVNKFIITDAEGYDTFEKYFGSINEITGINDTEQKQNLRENTLLIQIDEVNSGSIEEELKSVEISDGIDFKIDKTVPELGTTDMAKWYLVAIVPNDRLTNADSSEWFDVKGVETLIFDLIAD